MDSGPTHVEAKFVPKAPPDLDVSVEIRDTDMRALNDVWRAHGGFDVAAGRFSLFSNVTVRSGVINGYVKPLFQDIKVYDPKKEEGKSFGQKVKEAIVGGVATVLTDQSRDTVAARTDLSGRLDDPQASTLQILLSLLRNAFVKAILPGLEQYRPGQEANAKPPAPSEE